MTEHGFSMMWVCGRNDHGQLGVGSMDSIEKYSEKNPLVPHLEGPLTDLAERRVVQFVYDRGMRVRTISAGSMHTMFLGKCEGPQLPSIQIGTLFATGSNNAGQLGTNNKEDRTQATRVDNLYYASYDVQEIRSGSKHNIAISLDCSVWTWGQGWFGRLGHGDERFELKPKNIAYFSTQKIKINQVCCGGNSSAAVSNTGILYAWGYNEYGQCGTASMKNGKSNFGILAPQQVKVPMDRGVVHVEMGYEFMVAQTSDNLLFACGSNEFGQLGTLESGAGSGCKCEQLRPVDMSQLDQVVSYTCGGQHVIAINKKQLVFTWGRTEKGRLGIGRSKDNVTVPKLMQVFTPGLIKHVVAGDAHSFALTNTGRVYAWGLNKYSQCGFISGASSDAEAFEPNPVMLKNLRGVDFIATGGICAAGFSIFMICNKFNAAAQHVRDLCSAYVSQLVHDDPSLQLERDDESNTLLHIAAELGHVLIVDLLGEDAKSRDLPSPKYKNGSALHICAQLGYVKCVQMLLNKNASTTATNDLGQLPIHVACFYKHFEIARLLANTAEKLGLPCSILIRDKANKSVLNYCRIDEAYRIKCETNQYHDLVLLYSQDQETLGKKLYTELHKKQIKVWSDPDYSRTAEEIIDIVNISRGIIFLVGESTVQPNARERAVLINAKERKKLIFPIWQNIITLEPDVEAIIFRFQLVDFSDSTNFISSCNTLSVAIKNKLLQDETTETKTSEAEDADVDGESEDSAQINPSDELPFEQQTIFISYDSNDTSVAKTIISIFEQKQEIQVFNGAACKDASLTSTAAKNCFAVLVLLSKSSLHSSLIRDQISVAENNKKPIFALQLDHSEKLVFPLDFAYSLSITPLFVYRPADPEETVNQMLRAFRLKHSVNNKVRTYTSLNAELKRTELLQDFIKANTLNSISFHANV